MGIPEEFDVIWKGCIHNDKERGSMFDSEDYTRYCEKCKAKLTAITICRQDNVEPKIFIVKLDNGRQIDFKACPICGTLYEYAN